MTDLDTTTTGPAEGEGRKKVSRRSFVAGVGALAAGGLTVPFVLRAQRGSTPDRSGAGWSDGDAELYATMTPASAAGVDINASITVNTDGTVTINMGGCEMGQGAMTGLIQMAAEELKVTWDQVRYGYATPANAFLTGGSSAIRRQGPKIRVAAAQARDMLVQAAANQWGVGFSECTAVNGAVTHPTKGSLPYGQLAKAAALLPIPATPALTPAGSFRVIGQSVPRADIPAKTRGEAKFGIDVRLPGMLYAVVKHAPTIGGTLRTTPAVPAGATAVVPLKDLKGVVNAVAVVATNTWAAMQAASQLQASWTTPADAASNTTSKLFAAYDALLTTDTPRIADATPGAEAAYDASPKKIEAIYHVPYLAHATMEVLNATAWYKPAQGTAPASMEVWAPTQFSAGCVTAASTASGLPATAITVNKTFLGGGLGRKFETDYVYQACQVSVALAKPVKLMWPREEDFGRDQYRPMASIRVRVGLDASNKVTTFLYRNVSQSILGQRGANLGSTGVDSQAIEGAKDLPYAFPLRRVDWVKHDGSLPVGFWRSVGSSINSFAVECAIDEIAKAQNKDPYQLRRELLANDPRSLAVLDEAAKLGGWTTPVPAGRARGIAIARSFDSIVAEVVELSIPALNTIQVHSVAVAVQCGMVVNPDQVKAQMEGGVVHGLSAVLWGEVPFSSGRATTRNFNNYRMLKMREMPKVSVSILTDGGTTGGIGEVAVPPLAPAVANAYAKLTGLPVRNLPIFPGARMGD